MKKVCRRDLWAIRPGDELWCEFSDGQAMVEVTGIALDESRIRAKTDDQRLIAAISPWQINSADLLFVATSKRPETAFVMSGPLFGLHRPETMAEANSLKRASRQEPAEPTQLFRWDDVTFFVAPVTLATGATAPVLLAVWPGVSADNVEHNGWNWDQVLWLGPGQLFSRWHFSNVGYIPGGQRHFVEARTPALAVKKIVAALAAYEKGSDSPWQAE